MRPSMQPLATCCVCASMEDPGCLWSLRDHFASRSSDLLGIQVRCQRREGLCSISGVQGCGEIYPTLRPLFAETLYSIRVNANSLCHLLQFTGGGQGHFE